MDNNSNESKNTNSENNNNDNNNLEDTCNIFTTKVKSLEKTSPASLNSCRSLILNRKNYLVASDNKLIKLNIELPKIEQKIFSKIKGIPSPVRLETSLGREAVYQTGLKHEIQSLSLSADGKVIGAIDGIGNVALYQFQDDFSLSSKSIAYQSTDTFVEIGWAGCCFNPTNSNILAKTQFYNKKIDILDGDQITQSIGLIQNPTQISYFNHERSSSPLLAVTEFNQLKIYDTKQPPSSACIQKFTPSTTWLYSLGLSTNQQGYTDLIAVGGAGRTVSVFDTKKWTNCGNWKNCLKYEITSIQFSSKDSNVCYVGGLDSEVLAGNWDGSSGVDHFTGLRVDSRWLGISKLKDQELLFGFTGSSSVYWIDSADKLFQSTNVKRPSPIYTTSSKENNNNNNKKKNNKKQPKPTDLESSPKADKVHPLKKMKTSDGQSENTDEI
ncbi:hypothetical protein CYY_008145 [Polysphondylium violaceum]|uniref:WD40 repeat-containing protein n=1 Tax=Polysphondylium violaceum TaxID=133409 RepID=A0A8J4PM48_9MYCE|nr:hypothetical protein CYY_008145 [Polysphondylium violaceum]